MKTVLFDLGGTLWAPFGEMPREDVIVSAAEYAASQLSAALFRGLSPLEAEERRREFVKGLVDGVMIVPDRDRVITSGSFSDPIFAETPLEDTVKKVFRRVWAREPGDNGIALAFGHALTKHSTPYPESAPVLAQIREEMPHLTLGIVSNTVIQPEILDHYLQQCGLYRFFDFRVYSSRALWRKPHPAIYALALAEAGVKASEVVFVGDRVAEDLTAPTRFGMKSIFCCRGPLSVDPGADAVVNDLKPVPGLIRKMIAEESGRRPSNR